MLASNPTSAKICNFALARELHGATGRIRGVADLTTAGVWRRHVAVVAHATPRLNWTMPRRSWLSLVRRILRPVVATFVLAAAHELLELLRQSAHDQQRLGQTPDARAKLWACLSRARARVCVRARVPGLGAYVISGLLADVGTRTALARLAWLRPRDHYVISCGRAEPCRARAMLGPTS